MDTIQVVIMSETEARRLVDEIKTGINAIGDKLLELYDREGWKALGYGSWRDCITNEFDFGQSHAYRLLDFARVSNNIADFSPIGEKLPKPTNESQVRSIAKLPPAQQAQAWASAVKQSGDKPPTGKAVTEAAAVMGFPKEKQTARGAASSLPKTRSNGVTVERQSSPTDDINQEPQEQGSRYNLPLACDDNQWRTIRRAFDNPQWAAQVLLAAAQLSQSEIAEWLGIEAGEPVW